MKGLIETLRQKDPVDAFVPNKHDDLVPMVSEHHPHRIRCPQGEVLE